MKDEMRVVNTTEVEREVLKMVIDKYKLPVNTEFMGQYSPSAKRIVLFWHRNNITWGTNGDVGDGLFEDVTFQQFINRVVELQYRYTSVTLNSQYTAEIDKESKTVKVGCQTFTFEKIEELYNAIKQ